MRHTTAVTALAWGLVGLTGCSSGAATPDASVADGWEVEVVRDDLVGPTQLAIGADGSSVVVAELNGGEDAGEGRVRDLGPRAAAERPRVLLEGLLTPTGVAVLSATELVVQEQRELVAYGLRTEGVGEDEVPAVADRTVIDSGRPFNGRSHGTLTWLPVAGETTLVATASGRGSGPDVPEGSGELYVATRDDAGDWVTRTWSTGFKNAYAHTPVPARRALYVTEVGDGHYDGERPPDELVVVPYVGNRTLDPTAASLDAGWPRCIGDRVPVEANGGTVNNCAGTLAPLTTFPPGATPTSVAVTPDWRALVALWGEGRVVSVDPTTGEQTDVLTGVDQPLDLLRLDDGSVLLTVHGSGELWRIVPPA